MDEAKTARLLRRQAGVVARRQVVESRADETAVARRLRRREWARVHDGVYVEHTGPLPRRQRLWAGVLVHDGAVLAGESALEAHGVERSTRTRRRSDRVELAVSRKRRVADPPDVRTIQLTRFDELVQADASPPRMRLEPAALLVASREPDLDGVVAVLTDVVRHGRTTAARFLEYLELLPRLPQRALMIEVLTDVGVGVESALERRYLRDVERAHGLPRGDRQVHEAIEVVEGEPIHVVRRDVRYREQGTEVELDGRLGHVDAIDRWADLDRDLAAATQGSVALRAGWAQVLASCRLAAIVAAVLTARGWTGQLQPCGQDCTAGPARFS